MENKNHGQSLWIGLQRHFNTAIYAIQGASKKPIKTMNANVSNNINKTNIKKAKPLYTFVYT